MPIFARVFVIVLDSVGIGELPDAALYGDQGSNTLGNIAGTSALQPADARSARASGTSRPLLRRPARAICRGAAFGRMAEASPGQGFGDRALGD